MDTVMYLRNKILATIVRLVVSYSYGTVQAHPDEVLHIPSRDAGRTIKAHIYRSKAQRPSPVLINFHGSGFVIPFHGSDDEFARRICEDTDYTVIDAAYRLAPENPHPAAPNDAEDVVRWVLAHPLDYDLSNVVISGFSAGANLALVVASVKFPKDTFKEVIAFYPVTDIATEPQLKKAPDPAGKPMSDSTAATFNDCYTPHPIDRKAATISPTYTEGTGFPDNLVFITCSFDNLCLEAEVLADKIRSCPGKRVILRRMERCDHGWDKNAKPGTSEEKAKNEAYDLVINVLQQGASFTVR